MHAVVAVVEADMAMTGPVMSSGIDCPASRGKPNKVVPKSQIVSPEVFDTVTPRRPGLFGQMIVPGVAPAVEIVTLGVNGVAMLVV